MQGTPLHGEPVGKSENGFSGKEKKWVLTQRRNGLVNIYIYTSFSSLYVQKCHKIGIIFQSTTFLKIISPLRVHLSKILNYFLATGQITTRPYTSFAYGLTIMAIQSNRQPFNGFLLKINTKNNLKFF